MEYERKIAKALEYAERKKLKQEIHDLKHSNDRPRQKLTFSKLAFIFMMGNCVVIELYALVTMFFMEDLSSLSTLIAAVVGECICTCGYFVKSGKENSANGIVYETAMAKLQHELNTDDAVG